MLSHCLVGPVLLLFAPQPACQNPIDVKRISIIGNAVYAEFET
jgi:hypothetical protein